MSTAGFAIPAELDRDLRRFRTRSLMVGGAALLLVAAGAFLNPPQFFRSYLWAYLFYIGVTLGSTALMMLHHLTGGAWGLVIRRLLESASRTLPVLALLFVPVLFGIPLLYEWSHTDVVARDELLRAKAPYLNVPFFIARTVVYFLLWVALARLLNRWSLAQDRTGDPGLARKMSALSGPGLLIYGLTVSFAMVDWVMSLEPHWWSTIIGMLFMAAQGLSALSFIVALVVLLSKREPLRSVLTPRHLHDLGKLMLAFVMLWAYLSFSQLLIIWSGNLTDEIPWYLKRLQGGWGIIGILLVLFHFALPFALLLSRDIKRSTRTLAPVAGLVLAMRLFDLFWWVAPAFQETGHVSFHVHWLDFAAPVALGGLWLAAFLWQLQKRPLMPVGDPNLEEALAHGRE
ncbi:MAG: hypothetical protein IT158_19930 [Bryobacterales bacterium]|nr:hypothetical protein [Bryobacterales bacterium]